MIFSSNPKIFEVSKALDLIRSAGDKRWDFFGMGCEMSDLRHQLRRVRNLLEGVVETSFLLLGVFDCAER